VVRSRRLGNPAQDRETELRCLVAPTGPDEAQQVGVDRPCDWAALSGRGGDMNVSRAYANCERLARSAAGNFYPAFLVLPRDQRRAMYALYAFNRLTDDISDGPDGVAEKRTALDNWQKTLDRVLSDFAEHPYLIALRDAAQRFAIPHKSFHDVI